MAPVPTQKKLYIIVYALPDGERAELYINLSYIAGQLNL